MLSAKISIGDASPGAAKSVAVRNDTQDLVKESYSYNESGKRLHAITKSGGGSFVYDCFPSTDLIRSITTPNGVISSYHYEAKTGRLASVTTSIGSQTLYSISYSYNDNGQRDSSNVAWQSVAGSDQAENWELDYDEQDQLVFAHAARGEGTESYDYDFDKVGNHLESGWVVNELNQVKQIPGFDDYIQYDDRGNVSDDLHFNYTWDAQDRLIEAENSVARFEFGYDSQGRRVWKRSYEKVGNDWVLGQHLVFAYDGWNLLAEFRVVGNSQQLYRSYTRGPSLGGGIGGLLSITDHLASGGPKTYYPFYDGNGNVMGLSDSGGQVVATYRYDPFGKLIESAGPVAEVNPFRFSTKYYDGDTQLYYYGLRYYSPEMQRWMGRDPIEEEGGLNLYAFVGNDPVNLIDAVGLEVEGRGHMYPLFLGGAKDQVVFELAEAEHTKMHNYFRRLGFQSHSAESVAISKGAWKKLTLKERRAIVMEGMRQADIPESMIEEHIDGIMKGETPGVAQERKYGQTVSAKQIASRRAEDAAKRSAKVLSTTERLKGANAVEVRAADVVEEEWKLAGRSATTSSITNKGLTTASGVALATVMTTTSALDGFSNSKHCMTWYARTTVTVQKLERGEPAEDLDLINKGLVFNRAKDDLESAVIGMGGVEAGAGMIFTSQKFVNLANEVHAACLKRDQLNAMQ